MPRSRPRCVVTASAASSAAKIEKLILFSRVQNLRVLGASGTDAGITSTTFAAGTMTSGTEGVNAEAGLAAAASASAGVELIATRLSCALATFTRTITARTATLMIPFSAQTALSRAPGESAQTAESRRDSENSLIELYTRVHVPNVTGYRLLVTTKVTRTKVDPEGCTCPCE